MSLLLMCVTGGGESSESGSVCRGCSDEFQPRPRDPGRVTRRRRTATTRPETTEDRRQLKQTVQPRPDRLCRYTARGVQSRGRLRRGYVRRRCSGASQRVCRASRQQLSQLNRACRVNCPRKTVATQMKS